MLGIWRVVNPVDYNERHASHHEDNSSHKEDQSLQFRGSHIREQRQGHTVCFRTVSQGGNLPCLFLVTNVDLRASLEKEGKHTENK